jgi:hypothetical protein
MFISGKITVDIQIYMGATVVDHWGGNSLKLLIVCMKAVQSCMPEWLPD